MIKIFVLYVKLNPYVIIVSNMNKIQRKRERETSPRKKNE